MELCIPFSWEERQSVLLPGFFYVAPVWGGHATFGTLSWQEIFGREGPFVIEYCSGNGQWIVEKAKKYPALCWIGVEKEFSRARKIWKKGRELSNLLVVCGEAKIFSIHYVGEESLDQVFINFPDPWPKRRHAKHRLVEPIFIERVGKIAKKGARITIATDHFPYVEEMIEVFGKVPCWRSKIPAPYFAAEWPEYGDSFFASLWKSKGKEPYYLQYEKTNFANAPF